jgi:recombinational DNA repair protein (RecF pathway)
VSKQASHLDILNWVDFTLVHPKGSLKEQPINGYSIITQAYSLRTFSNLKTSLPAMAAAFFVLEAFDKLVFEGDYDEKLWEFLVEKFDELDKSAIQKRIDWSSVFQLTRQNIAKTMGYEPEICVEDLAGKRFYSLQFAKLVIR